MRKGNSLNQNLIYTAATKGAEERIDSLSSHECGTGSFISNTKVQDTVDCLGVILQCDPDLWDTCEFREVYSRHFKGHIGKGIPALCAYYYTVHLLRC